MRPAPVPVSSGWLALRERADAAARSPDLARRLAAHLAPARRLTIHDLGGGTGAMGRWLAPRLRGPQHWVVHDRDAELLEAAAAAPPAGAADGAPITVETRQSDLTRLAPDDLAGADVVVASALLDLLTAGEIAELLARAMGVGACLLLSLTVVGRVTLTPADPLDEHIAAAFDAHQRRGGLLGPGAAAAAAAQLRRAGADVLVRPSPWRLGATHAALTAAWLDGWIAAAREQEPHLADAAGAYRARRRAQLAAGDLAVTVGHADLLVPS